MEENEHQHRKGHLDRIAIMLSKLGGRGYTVQEEPGMYGDIDPDFDFDSDLEKDKTRDRH